MDSQNNYQTEKLSQNEKKKKAELERRTGVPNPSVPNRAYTEMSAAPFGESPFYVNTKKRMNDAKRRTDTE